ncbi:MAG: hypothetical protein NTX63_03375 [Candidatus Peregrinibacteria bacterium]|nr:hypothetical protein [Candidatus Peregrinibacteria bacterium]
MSFLGRHSLPICFSKHELRALSPGTPMMLNGRIQRALKSGKLLKLKKGMYVVAENYIQESDKTKLTEFVASQLYRPSYISLEYVLEKHGMLTRADGPILITSITTKNTSNFKNFAGNYTYRNVKPSIYFGFEKVIFRDNAYHIATKAKALFDHLYLNAKLDCRNGKRLYNQIFKEAAYRWENFSEEDFRQFDSYVWKSNSRKMMKIREVIEKYFDGKKFDMWAKAILS